MEQKIRRDRNMGRILGGYGIGMEFLKKSFVLNYSDQAVISCDPHMKNTNQAN